METKLLWYMLQILAANRAIWSSCPKYLSMTVRMQKLSLVYAITAALFISRPVLLEPYILIMLSV